MSKQKVKIYCFDNLNDVNTLYPLYEQYGVEIVEFVGHLLSERRWVDEPPDDNNIGYKSFCCKFMENGDLVYIIDINGYVETQASVSETVTQLTIHVSMTDDLYSDPDYELIYVGADPSLDDARIKSFKSHLREKLEMNLYEMRAQSPVVQGGEETEWEKVKYVIELIASKDPPVKKG